MEKRGGEGERGVIREGAHIEVWRVALYAHCEVAEGDLDRQLLSPDTWGHLDVDVDVAAEGRAVNLG